jgi:hypothetical protein
LLDNPIEKVYYTNTGEEGRNCGFSQVAKALPGGELSYALEKRYFFPGFSLFQIQHLVR